MSEPDFLRTADTLGIAVTEASREVVADTVRKVYCDGIRRAAYEIAEEGSAPPFQACVEFLTDLADTIERGER